MDRAIDLTILLQLGHGLSQISSILMQHLHLSKAIRSVSVIRVSNLHTWLFFLQDGQWQLFH